MLAYAAVILRYRRSIITIIVAGIVLTLVSSWIIPPVYRAECKVVPAAQLAPGVLSGGFSGLQQAASDLGLDLPRGQGNPSGLLPGLIASRAVLDRVLDLSIQVSGKSPTTLLEYLRPRGDTDQKRRGTALARLRDHVLNLSYDARSGITTIAAHARQPEVAAAVANAAVESMKAQYGRLQALSAGQREEYVETRLQDIHRRLGADEEALLAFRRQNRRISDSPDLQMEHERLMRAVELDQRIYLELAARREALSLEAHKDFPDLAVLDEAVADPQPFAPRRARFLIVSAIILSLLAVGQAFSRDYWDVAREEPVYRKLLDEVAPSQGAEAAGRKGR